MYGGKLLVSVFAECTIKAMLVGCEEGEVFSSAATGPLSAGGGEADMARPFNNGKCR